MPKNETLVAEARGYLAENVTALLEIDSLGEIEVSHISPPDGSGLLNATRVGGSGKDKTAFYVSSLIGVRAGTN